MHRILAGIEFRTQAAIKDHARKIRERYKDGEKLIGIDDLFFRDFIKIHQRADEKIGCGIDHFTIQLDGHWKNSRQFVLVRTNGARAIFSINKISEKLELPEERHRKRVFDAMREAIRSQIDEFRNENFFPGKTICPLTGVIIVKAHVDHEKPQTFEALVYSWLESRSLSFADIAVDSDTDKRTFETMANQEQLVSWQRYHLVHARLRILSDKANLGIARRG